MASQLHTNPKRLDGIQALRGIGAFLVVVAHAQSMFDSYHSHDGLKMPWFSHRSIDDFGSAGVDIFFVISGFIITHVAWTRFNTPHFTKDFLIRRMIRVVPLYWICTTAMVFVFLFFPGLIHSGKTTSLPHIVASYLFIPWAQGTDKTPILTVGWSLNYEILFYLLFGLFLKLKRSAALTGIISILLLSTGLGLYANESHLWFFSNTVILEFVFGIILAILFHKKLLPRVFSPLFFLGWLSLILIVVKYGLAPPQWRGLTWGLPAALIVAGALNWSHFYSVPSFLVKLGDISYSLYLTHFFVGVTIGRMWMAIAPQAPVEVLALLVVIVPCLFAYGVFNLIEHPLNIQFLKIYKRSA